MGDAAEGADQNDCSQTPPFKGEQVDNQAQAGQRHDGRGRGVKLTPLIRVRFEPDQAVEDGAPKGEIPQNQQVGSSGELCAPAGDLRPKQMESEQQGDLGSLDGCQNQNHAFQNVEDGLGESMILDQNNLGFSAVKEIHVSSNIIMWKRWVL